MTHIIFDKRFQVRIDGGANIEAAGGEELHSKLSIAIPQSVLYDRNDPIHKMRVTLNIMEAGKFDRPGKGLYLVDHIRGNWPQLRIFYLVAQPQVDPIIQCEHLIEYIILAHKGIWLV